MVAYSLAGLLRSSVGVFDFLSHARDCIDQLNGHLLCIKLEHS